MNKNLSAATLLVNPFQKIAGVKALIIGGAILLLMSFLGVMGNVYFNSALSIHIQTSSPDFFLLAYQNIVACLVLSICFALAAKLYRKKTRFIDFIGTVTFARYPYLFVTALMAIIQNINPGFLAFNEQKNAPLETSLGITIFGISLLILAAWQVATYFYAFKESSGLIGKKLWSGFILSLIVAEVITQQLTRLLIT